MENGISPQAEQITTWMVYPGANKELAISGSAVELYIDYEYIRNIFTNSTLFQ